MDEIKKSEKVTSNKGNIGNLEIKKTQFGFQVFSKKNGKTFLVGSYATEEQALKAKSEYNK